MVTRLCLDEFFSFKHKVAGVLVEIPVAVKGGVYGADLGDIPGPIAPVFSGDDRFGLLIQRRSIGTSGGLASEGFLHSTIGAEAPGNPFYLSGSIHWCVRCCRHRRILSNRISLCAFDRCTGNAGNQGKSHNEKSDLLHKNLL